MATESVAAARKAPLAKPIRGEFTECAEAHAWCAAALATVLTHNEPLSSYDDEVREALQYLLACETRRASKASVAGDV
jgi:hypothetical protein